MKVRQQRLGHGDAKMTMDVYTHIASEDDVSIATTLGGILDPSGTASQLGHAERIEMHPDGPRCIANGIGTR
ncbi:MAG: hypothetical protein WB869_19695 [Candidatus Acidiferrales bacterium]